MGYKAGEVGRSRKLYLESDGLGVKECREERERSDWEKIGSQDRGRR